MSEPNELGTQQLDDQLAAFVDQVLAGGIANQDLTLSDQSELRSLQDIVLRLRRNLPDTPVSATMSRQMQSKLSAHWATEGPKPQPASPLAARIASTWARLRSWLLPERQVWQSSSARQRAWTLRAVTVTLVVILAVVAVFSPILSDNLAGTAGLEGGAVPLAILLIGIVVVVVAWWWVRRKRKP
jgi:hypothetical protein